MAGKLWRELFFYPFINLIHVPCISLHRASQCYCYCSKHLPINPPLKQFWLSFYLISQSKNSRCLRLSVVRRPFDVNYITVMINWTEWSAFTCHRHRSDSERLLGDKNWILFNERSGARETISPRIHSFVGIMAESQSSSFF